MQATHTSHPGSLAESENEEDMASDPIGIAEETYMEKLDKRFAEILGTEVSNCLGNRSP